MNAHDQDHQQTRLKKLLHEALPPVEADAGAERDLWPAMLRRLDASPAAPGWAWFDGALLAGLVGLAALFPTAIPVFLYCL